MLFARYSIAMLIGSAFLWFFSGGGQTLANSHPVLQSEITPVESEPVSSENAYPTGLVGTPQPPAPGEALPTSQISTTVISTITVTATITLTPTATMTMTATPTATVTATPTISPTVTPTPSATPFPGALIPLLIGQNTVPPFPSDRIYTCQSTSQTIPDNDSNGTSASITLDDTRFLHDLNIYLRVSHPWVGDLSATLTHLESGKSLELFNRPGIQSNSQGCGQANIGAILDDEISLPVNNQCSASTAAVAGIFQPNQPLSTFDGDLLAGTWTLNVADHYKADVGRLDQWCLVAEVGSVPTPTPTPEPKSIPSKAHISNISSQPQAYPLDCESRVAVDWAAYFGFHIDETTFFNDLPRSDNPDTGFVGSVFGTWGQIPPKAYGVHAEPIAALLRDFGVPAYAHRPLSWDDLRWEISQGRPVYVWTIGNSSTNQIPVYYTPGDGNTTIVAHYEHTVMVIGYNDNNVTILDNGNTYTRSIQQFLASWSALDNMALLSHP
jgi:subtilisin-like proprotein convertase family protein